MGDFISAPEVARILNVTPRRVHQLDDVLQPLRAGRARLYDRAAVERYAAARDAKASAQ